MTRVITHLASAFVSRLETSAQSRQEQPRISNKRRGLRHDEGAAIDAEENIPDEKDHLWVRRAAYSRLPFGASLVWLVVVRANSLTPRSYPIDVHVIAGYSHSYSYSRSLISERASPPPSSPRIRRQATANSSIRKPKRP